MSPSSPEYTRYSHSHEIQKYFGKKGEVYSVTTVYDPPEDLKAFAPYDEVMVEFPDGTRRVFMAAYGEIFDINDEVECVVGVNSSINSEGILTYKIRVRHPIGSKKERQTRFD